MGLKRYVVFDYGKNFFEFERRRSMEIRTKANLKKAVIECLIIAALLFIGVFMQSDLHAQSITVNVVDDNGSPITNGFRWLLEEDNTFFVTPGVANPSPGNPASHTLGVNIHRSHAPVVCSGDTASSSVTISNGVGGCVINPAKRYMVSVLPWHSSAPGTPPFLQKGWTQSGRNVNLAGGQTSVSVVVHAFPVPTAQITVLVFNDNMPINGAMDLPAELGLPNFNIVLNDPIGKVMQDAFANPLGTDYYTVDPVTHRVAVDGSGNPIMAIDSATGLPVPTYKGNGTLKTCPTTDAAYNLHNCYNPDGTALGPGEAVVRFLNGNKYTIEIVPPDNDPGWILTATLEGTRGNDAWVRPGEPRFNIILGQLNWLVFYGFVKNLDCFNTGNPNYNAVACTNITPGGTTGSITGRVVYVHDMHPPLSPGLSPGLPVPECYVGLNNLSGADEQVYTAPCNPDSTFSISGVPPGSYQLVMWDKPINAVIDFRSIVVPPTGGTITLGDVPVYGWFGTFMGSVFNDANRNAFRDCVTPTCDNAAAGDEVGIPNQLINIRFTDGSIYSSTFTDNAGNYSFNQVFPWWRWVVTEVDGSRFRATGLTAVVDDGGPLPATGTFRGIPFRDLGINPQPQPENNNLPWRTEQGVAVYTEPMILYSNMTNLIDWGKTAVLLPGEHGSIAGVVYYATTRTEENPQNGVADPWEPAIPRVTVNLYHAIQNANGNWVTNGPVFMTYFGQPAGGTDSFDDNNPTGCVGSDPLWANPQIVNGIPIKDCAETFRTWDQIRPGVYDGAYFFADVPPGNYIVEIVPPVGYEVLKWGDRNIEFGDPKIPALAYPPQCVGPSYAVPRYHTLFPDQQVPTEGWFPGMIAPLCNRKLAVVSEGQNFGADFFLFTPVPKSARIWGWVSNDLLLEFNPNSPNAGANFAPSWLPVSIKDYKGVEVARVYTDQWGKFNVLLPSNYDIAPPIPLGLALSMLSIFPNDPGPIVDTRPGSPTFGKMITDPWFNPAYGQEVIRENWEFWAGRTTFVDTIVIPISAFVANRVPLNCDFLSGTPEIYSVMGPSGGPLLAAGGGVLTIRSVGSIQVPNPDYNPNLPIGPANPTMITRDHGFGGVKGTVKIGSFTIPAANLNWAADGLTISANVPAGATTGQLIVTRGDNLLSTEVGVTVHVVVNPATVHFISPPPASCVGLACGVIQPVINAPTTHSGDLIILMPGRYQENVIMYKPVKIQGSGAPSTVFDGTAALANLPLKNQWNTFIQTLFGTWIDLVPNAQGNFVFEQGAGILVAACDPAQSGCTTGNQFTLLSAPLIDGLTITGANEAGGGIYVNGYAPYLQISNNEIFANQGGISGGIRVGTSSIVNTAGNGYESSHNENIKILYNRISQNGSLFSGGGGISLYKGSDNYQVMHNMVCGNHSVVYGGGILHFGYSPNGLIADNKVVSNESVDEGGGIMIAGELVPAGQPLTALTEGSGSVTIDANLIQGNQGGDDGGGIRTLMVSGQDVRNNPGNQGLWHVINIFNNMIVNNESKDIGGAISLDDTVFINVINNTISHNDSTSTGSDAFGGPCVPNNPPGQICPAEGEAIGGLTNSVPRVGGIAAYAFSTPLQAVVTAGGSTKVFADPLLVNNIIWQNRSFYWDAAYCNNFGGLRPDVNGICGTAEPPVYWDLAVYNTANPLTTMSPTYSILTDGVGATPAASNLIGANPMFINPYFNNYEATSKGAAFGNFVTTTFTPNGLRGDYHIPGTSPAVSVGTAGSPFSDFAALASDYDGDPRPRPDTGSGVDIGADEISWTSFFTPNWTPVMAGKTSSAPAVAWSGSKFYIAVRGMDNGIYIGTADPPPGTFNGNWTKLSSGSTPSAPAMAWNNGNLSVVVRGVDNKIYGATVDPTTLNLIGSWTPITGGVTPSTVAIALNGGNLYVAARGMDNRIYGATVDPTTWAFIGSGWTPVPVGATPDAPAIAWNPNGSLNVIVKGGDNTIYGAAVDPATWALNVSWTQVFPVGMTSSAPAIAWNGTINQLHIVVRGADNKLYSTTVDATIGTLSGWTVIPAGTTPDAPAIALNPGAFLLYVVARGMDNGLYTWSVTY
jgi:hypothetical protein